MNVFIEKEGKGAHDSPPLNWNGSSGCQIAISDQHRCVSEGLTDFWF